MKIYIVIVIVALAVIGGTMWLGNNLQQPVAVASPSATPTPSPIPTTSLVAPAGGVTMPSPVRALVPAKNEGTVVFAIKDKAESLDNFQYILLQLTGVSVHSSKGPWISMKSTPPLLDLLKLYRMGDETAFLTELNVPVGTYDQIRLDVGAIVLVTKDGVHHDAKLPSKQIKLNARLVAEHGNQSSVTVDIMSDKSIHLTGNGKYIFSPVVNLETRSKLDQVQVLSSGFVTLIGGKTDTSLDAGMDENGNMKKDFMFDADISFDVVGDAVHLIPKDKTDEANVKVTPQQAIDLAIQSGNVSSVLSVKIMRRANKLVWQVTGVKDEKTGTVYIDVITGLVTGTE